MEKKFDPNDPNIQENKEKVRAIPKEVVCVVANRSEGATFDW